MKDNYFEIGRGAKLIPMEYWHQFVLGVDLTQEVKYFVVSEVGKDEILFKKNISFEELINTDFDELLKISKTKDFIHQFINYSEDTLRIKNELKVFIDKAIEIFNKIDGEWISINEYENINYNFNFDWVDAYEIKGKIHFTLKINSAELKNCRVDIPVNYYSMGEGTCGVIYGKFQMSIINILVWQNNIFPTTIGFQSNDDLLVL